MALSVRGKLGFKEKLKSLEPKWLWCMVPLDLSQSAAKVVKGL